MAFLDQNGLRYFLGKLKNTFPELDENGKVPASKLPSYVDDVLEYETYESFPLEGETGKIYVDLTTNKTYRWGGSAYVEISESLALGETSSTAYRGDRGKTAYDHATDANKLSTAQNSGFYKVSVTSQGHVGSVTDVAKSDITDLGIAPTDNPVFTGSISMGRAADTTVGAESTAFGSNVTSSGASSHAEGSETIASGINSHAEGTGGTYTSNDVTYTSGALGMADHTEGYQTLTASDSSTYNAGRHAEGYKTQALGASAHAEGNGTTASGGVSHAEGLSTTASGSYSHAEGTLTTASGSQSHSEGLGGTFTDPFNSSITVTSKANSVAGHTEGYQTCADGAPGNHAEGFQTQAYGSYGSHAEGYQTKANGGNSHPAHAEGSHTQALGDGTHAEGYYTTASGYFTHAEGMGATATGTCAHAEGNYTTAYGPDAHAEGSSTKATGSHSHAEGAGGSFTPRGASSSIDSISSGNSSHSEGYYTAAVATGAHSEGINTYARAEASHAEGSTTEAQGTGAHSEGYQTYAASQGAHAEGEKTKATSNSAHAEGEGGTPTNESSFGATGQASHSEGYHTLAGGWGAHAEGYDTVANNKAAHSEGYGTRATAMYTHAEGESTQATFQGSHAEGYGTRATGKYTHAEGESTQATVQGSHAEGYSTTSSGGNSHAEGGNTTASGYNSHAEGDHTIASANAAHAEGYYMQAAGTYSHAEGYGGAYMENNETKYYGAFGEASHVEGYHTLAPQSAYAAHAEGYATKATGSYSHAEGYQTEATTSYTHAEGYGTKASSSYAHSEGNYTTASGNASHAEGNYTKATTNYTHAEGYSTTASGDSSHAEGYNSTASGMRSHAEGFYAVASGGSSHAEGDHTEASGTMAHAEGEHTIASGLHAHVEGYYTTASGAHSHVQGYYNVQDSYDSWPEWEAGTQYMVGDKVKRTTTSNDVTSVKGYECKTANSDAEFTYANWTSMNGKMNYADIVGNGTYETRSNASALDWDGNLHLMGDVYVGCNPDSTGGIKLAPIKAIEAPLTYVSNVSGAYTATTLDPRITSDMKCILLELGNAAAFKSNVIVTAGEGQITLTCSDVQGDSTAVATFMPVNSRPKNTITFVLDEIDGGGTLSTQLETYGTIPSYTGEEPVSTRDGMKFAGWDPEIAPVTEDQTYTAVFKQIPLIHYLKGTMTEYESNTATKIASYAFNGRPLTNVTTTARVIEQNAFVNCSSLLTVDFTNPAEVVDIKQQAFNGCTNLKAIFIRSNQVATVANDAFVSSIFIFGNAAIYVPANLVDSYKAATNWSSFADRIYPIEAYPVSNFDTIKDDWATIISKVNSGTADYSLGDTKTLDLGTEGKAKMVIVGVNKDELADNSGNTAKYTWWAKIMPKTKQPMNSSTSGNTEGTGAVGGWEHSEMREYLAENGTIWNLLPAELQASGAIKAVKKYSRIFNTNRATNRDAENNVATTDKLFLLSSREVGGQTDYSETLGPTYTDYFNSNARRTGYLNTGSASHWWLRSAGVIDSDFAIVTNTGSWNGNKIANDYYGVDFGYCT